MVRKVLLFLIWEDRSFKYDIRKSHRIGRADGNDIIISSDPLVSGKHGVVFNGSFTDLGSTNGTFINGERVDRDTPVKLSEGDKIMLGDTSFHIESMDVEEDASDDEFGFVDENEKEGEGDNDGPPGLLRPTARVNHNVASPEGLGEKIASMQVEISQLKHNANDWRRKYNIAKRRAGFRDGVGGRKVKLAAEKLDALMFQIGYGEEQGSEYMQHQRLVRLREQSQCEIEDLKQQLAESRRQIRANANSLEAERKTTEELRGVLERERVLNDQHTKNLQDSLRRNAEASREASERRDTIESAMQRLEILVKRQSDNSQAARNEAQQFMATVVDERKRLSRSVKQLDETASSLRARLSADKLSRDVMRSVMSAYIRSDRNPRMGAILYDSEDVSDNEKGSACKSGDAEKQKQLELPRVLPILLIVCCLLFAVVIPLLSSSR